MSFGECLALVLGYSFGDQHLNELLLQGLRSNPRLAVTVLMYSDPDEQIFNYASLYRNLSLFTPTRASVGGVVGKWGGPFRERKGSEVWPFWDDKSKKFLLGGFQSFASFLELFIGFKPSSFGAAEVGQTQVTE